MRRSSSTRAERRGFTLVELLVVIAIILFVGAATIGPALNALNGRQVGEAARILHAELAGARDRAIMSNRPAGFRLLPDPLLTVPAPGTVGQGSTTLAYNRIVPLETGNGRATKVSQVVGTYSVGKVSIKSGANPTLYYEGADPFNGYAKMLHPSNLRLEEEAYADVNGTTPNEPCTWFWNVRIGDKVRIDGVGSLYTVVGPAVINPNNPSTPGENPELYCNDGPPGSTSAMVRFYGPLGTIPAHPHYLYLVNGVDDDADGTADEGWNGFNDNYNWDKSTPAQPYIDEWEEWEPEKWTGSLSIANNAGTLATNPILNKSYVIYRRPAPTPGAREIQLPQGVAIDATTWNSTQERSRLPVDPSTLYVDIIVNPNGTVVPTTIYSTPAGFGSPFYHFWLTDREDVLHPVAPPAGQALQLPIAGGTGTRTLKNDRRLVTLFARTGNTAISSLETFDAAFLKNPSVPFYAAQMGIKEAP
jgi:prepilin-type N-terminal cleavage/methylation domain-containing protein